MDRKKILIIEDETSLRHALKEKLTHEGFFVLEGKNGVEGLEVALREHPDLLLLDLSMPKMGGLEMAKKLREDAWGKTAKIIILTNISGDMNTVAESMNNEIFDYFIKSDIKIEDVVIKVKEHLK